MDEAFGLPVGARPIGSGEAVAHLPAFAEPAEDSRAISTAVVRQQASGLNAPGREPVQRPFQKVGGGLPPLVGKDLDVSDARVIVDADMDKLPADATDVGRAIAVDAVTDPSDTPQFLGVDVKKFPGRRVLVRLGDGRGASRSRCRDSR